MSSKVEEKIKSLQKAITLKAKDFPLHSPEVVELSEEVDEYVLLAMKEINNISS